MVADSTWLRSKDRAFPITIDPDVRFDGLVASNGQFGVVDTFIASGEPYQNFNGQNLNVGYCSVNHGETYSYVKWNLGSLANQQIANAQLAIYPTWTNANTATQPIRMWHVAENWDPNTFTWDSTHYGQGNHDNVMYGLYGANAGSEHTYNLTDWVRNWTNGTWANYGVSMDGAGISNLCYVLKSQEDGVYAPRLIVTTAPAVDAGPDTGRCDCMGYFDQTIDPTTGMFVNLGNGNLQVSATDLSAPGRGMDMRVERNWSSLRSSTQHEFGNGWQFGTMQARVVPMNADGSGNAIVYLPGYSPRVYTNTNGVYAEPGGANATLTKTGTGANTVWTMNQYRAGKIWTFRDMNDGTSRAYLSQIADRNNNQLNFGYDFTSRIGAEAWPWPTTITDTFGQTTTFAHNNNGMSSVTDWTGRQATYANANGKLNSVTNVDGGVTAYAYDTNGRIARVTSPQGRIIEFTYFTDGRAQSVKWVTPSSTDVDPSWSFAYQPLTNGKGTTTLQYPNGKTTTYKWDANYRIVETIDPLGHSHSQTWTTNNAIATSTDAKSNTATNTYDPANNNLSKAQSPNLDASTAGRATTYQYTDANNPYKATNITSPDGTVRAFAYDGAGNQTSSNQGSGSNTQNASLTYNANGTVASATDGNAHTTSYGYDGAGRMTSVTHPAPMGTETLTYDSVGRVRTYTDGKGQTTTLSYNNKNQLITSVSHTGTTITYGYDGDGLMTSRNDAIGAWSFGYDALRRVTSKTQPGGFSTTLTYDLAGNITSSTDNNGTTTFAYDDANNMTKLAEPGGSCVGTVSLCSTFTYDENNRRTAATYPNGVKQSTTYDSSGRIEKHYAELGTTKLTDYTYSYKTAAGADDNKLQSVLDGIKGERTTFEYDSHGRLTVPRTYNSGGTKILTGTYTWDGATNRLTSWLSSDSSGTKTYTYNAANELTARGSSALTYDANGSRITGNNSFTATYNDRNQAVTINGVAQTYADSGQTERVTSGSKTFHTGLLGGLADEVQSGTTTSYVRDNDGNLISQKKNSVRHYFLVDYQASVVALADNTGVIAQRFDYGNFGDLKTTTITVDSSFKYANGYYDAGPQLLKYGERYYDPKNAVWTQRDTIAGNISDPATMNRYSYVGGDPVNFVDPSGMITISSLAKDVGSAVAGTAVSIGVFAATGNPILAGAAGGCVGTATSQALNGGGVAGAAAGCAIGAGVGAIGGRLMNPPSGAHFR